MATIEIRESSVAVTEEVVFEYQQIGPGFSAIETVPITNHTDTAASVELLELTLAADDPNQLLPPAYLSVRHDGKLLIENPVGGTITSLVDQTFCVQPQSQEELEHHFELPTTVGNTHQGATLKVIFQAKVALDSCFREEVDPVYQDPEVPDTGLWGIAGEVGGAVAVTGAGLVFALLIVLLLRRRPAKRKR